MWTICNRIYKTKEEGKYKIKYKISAAEFVFCKYWFLHLQLQLVTSAALQRASQKVDGFEWNRTIAVTWNMKMNEWMNNDD